MYFIIYFSRDRDWETFYEITQFINNNLDNGYIKEVREANGVTALYEVAREWTNKFEKEHEGKEWDGEYLEYIDSFCEEMNKY